MTAVKLMPPTTPGQSVSSDAPTPRRRKRVEATPYVLVVPTLIVLGGLLAYPLTRMVALSFQRLTLRDLFTGSTPAWAGFANYRAVLASSFFWTVAGRTILVATICVVLSVGLGLLVALLMGRVSGWVRITMTVSMMLVWSIPQLVSTQIFAWLIDADWGVVNYLIDQLPGVDYSNHSWFVNSLQGWTVIVALVVWGAIPFLAISLYAGLTQVPREQTEAARVDGAGPWQVFRHVTFPYLRPLLGIVTTLSAIWDMSLFTQIYVIRSAHPERDFYTLAVYAYREAFGNSDYSLGSAISILTVLLMLGVMAVYVRQMFRIGDAD